MVILYTCKIVSTYIFFLLLLSLTWLVNYSTTMWQKTFYFNSSSSSTRLMNNSPSIWKQAYKTFRISLTEKFVSIKRQKKKVMDHLISAIDGNVFRKCVSKPDVMMRNKWITLLPLCSFPNREIFSDFFYDLVD